MEDRKAMSAIFYVLRTGCHWNALPNLGFLRTLHSKEGGRLASIACRVMVYLYVGITKAHLGGEE